MDKTFTLRLPRLAAGHLDRLATLVGRPKSHVLRLLVSRASEKDLPPGWVATAAEERLVMGAPEAMPVSDS